MDDFFALRVTRGDLERALLKLDFSLTITDTHRLYHHEASHSIFGFALNIPQGQNVRPAHPSGSRHAAVAMGVTDAETFRKLLLGETVEQIPRGVMATKPPIPTAS